MYAVRCSCGAYRIRSERPLDDATFSGRVLAWRITRFGYGLTIWDVIVERPGEPANDSHAHVFTNPVNPPLDAALAANVDPEDRISIDAQGRAVRTHTVRAQTFLVQANAQAFCDALIDAINMVVIAQGVSDMQDYLSSITPRKHPGRNEWAVICRPKMRGLCFDRAETLLVRTPNTLFEDQVLPNTFFRTNLSTTQTRFNQMRVNILTSVDLDGTWGL